MRGKKRKTTTWKNRLIKLAAVLVGGFLLLTITAGILAKSFITKGFLIDEIENSINSDVEIGDVDISIFQLPAKVTLSDVSFTPKNSQEKAPIRIKMMSLSAGLFGLLRKHIDVTNITIRGAEITATYYKDGSTSIESLFESPDEKKRKKPGEKKKGGGFNISDHEDFVATLGGLSIIDSKIDLTLEEMGLRLRCTDVDLSLNSIKIDPKKLAETNTAKLNISSKVKIDSTAGWQYGNLVITGQSTAIVFNPTTGDVEPEVEGEFNLGEESWLNTRVPFITRAWNHLTILEKVGIKVASLPEKATFGRSEAVAAHYHLGRITVNKPISIWIGDWELAAMNESWLDTGTDQHEINGELLASKGSSVHFRSLILKGVGLLPDQVQASVTSDVEQKLFQDERLLVKLKSSGDFSDPKIRPGGVIMDFSEAAKEAAKKLLKEKAGGFLNGLLGGDKDEDEEAD